MGSRRSTLMAKQATDSDHTLLLVFKFRLSKPSLITCSRTMQSCQTKPVAASTSSLKPQPKPRSKDDLNEENRGKTTSAGEIISVRIRLSKDIDKITELTCRQQDTLGSEGTRPGEGKTAWHMERWLNETSGEEAWSVHGRF